MTPPYFGRLKRSGRCYSSWLSLASTAKKWLQIDMDRLDFVAHVVTQGSTHSEYVQTFYLMHSIDAVKWEDHQENGRKKVVCQ